MRAAIYCRISDDRDGTRVGVARQEDDCRRLADQRGWDVADVFVDNHVSAWKRNRRRPGWDQLIAGLADKRYDAVVVYHGDRLIRQPRDLEDLLDIADRGVQLASPAGQRDLANPDDRFILRIEVAQACKSSDDTSRRVRRAHLSLAEQGKVPGGGSRPFGFDDTRLEIRPDEAALIREAADRVLAGDTLRSICADWTARGVPTISGSPWTTHVLRRILTSGRIAGWREHHGELVAPAVWPAIVDRTTVEHLRGLLRDPARRANRSPRRYLLTGLAVCGRDGCDARLVARPRSDKARCYVCASGPGFHGCGKIRRLAEPVEAEVVRRMLHRLDTPALTDARARHEGREHEVAALVDALAVEERNLEQLARDHYGTRLTSRAEYLAGREPVLARQSELRARLAALQRDRRLDALAGQGASLAASWEMLSFERRRAIVEAVVEQVTVLPAVPGRNVFDPRRVKVRWRV